MRKLLLTSSILTILTGAIFATGGIWGIVFTYKNIVREKIVTPADAFIPEKPVRGPLTLKAQADIIRTHTLRMTDGKTFAEMPRQIPKLNQDGQPVLDEQGNPVMVLNTARDIWITATTLTTALHLGILSYIFSTLVLLLGFMSIWTGIGFYGLSRRNI